LSTVIATMSVESIDTLTELNNLMIMPRNVEVSNISLKDDDNDAANGVASMNQVITAEFSSELLPSDKVLMSINGQTALDVSDYVINNQLRYGHDEVEVTLYKNSNAMNGFTSYMVGVVPDGATSFQTSVGAKEIFVPTADLLREGEYSYIAAPSISTAALAGSTDLVLTANGSYIKSTDTVIGHLILANGANGSFDAGDLSFTLSDDGSTISFDTVPTPLTGTDFYLEIKYHNGVPNSQNLVSTEVVKMVDDGSFTPTLPTGATHYTYGNVTLGLEMALNVAGEYATTLDSSYFNDIDNAFTPFNVQVVGADGVVYAQDSSLVGATYETAVPALDFATINQLQDGDGFTAKVQVIDVPSDTALDILTSGPTGVVGSDVAKGNFVVSQNDQIVIRVTNAQDNDITTVSTSGDNIYVVDLNNPVDFLGIDINDDDDYADLYETATNGIVGVNDSDTDAGDSTVSVYLDVSDAATGDVIELYADGVLIATSAAMTQEQISTGSLTLTNVSDGKTVFDLTTYDTANGSGTADDDKVVLEVKVQNGSSTYSQDGGDVTWEYQW